MEVLYRRNRPSASGLDPEAVHRHGKKYRVLTNFPPTPLSRAPRYCEEYLVRYADRLLEQFERWHDIFGPWRTQESE
jgi:hypothetical protein